MWLWILAVLGALAVQQEQAHALLRPSCSRICSRAPPSRPQRSTVLFSSSLDELSQLTVPKLKERLREAGLPVGGLKAELVARLEAQGGAVGRTAPARPASQKEEKQVKQVKPVKQEKPEKAKPSGHVEIAAAGPDSRGAREKVLWSSAEHPADTVEGWWKDLGKALMTVGSKGVTDGHVSSLKDLLGQHQRVRVKFATDKVDALALAEALVGTGPLKDQAELLVVKPRGLMVGRGGGSDNWPALATPKARSANSKAVCYGCGEIGHHRVECPNKKRAGFMAVGTHPDAARVEAVRAQEEEDRGREKKKGPVGKSTKNFNF